MVGVPALMVPTPFGKPEVEDETLIYKEPELHTCLSWSLRLHSCSLTSLLYTVSVPPAWGQNGFSWPTCCCATAHWAKVEHFYNVWQCKNAPPKPIVPLHCWPSIFSLHKSVQTLALALTDLHGITLFFYDTRWKAPLCKSILDILSLILSFCFLGLFQVAHSILVFQDWDHFTICNM